MFGVRGIDVVSCLCIFSLLTVLKNREITFVRWFSFFIYVLFILSFHRLNRTFQEEGPSSSKNGKSSQSQNKPRKKIVIKVKKIV